MNCYWFIYDNSSETDMLILKILFTTRKCGLFTLKNVFELQDNIKCSWKRTHTFCYHTIANK